MQMLLLNTSYVSSSMKVCSASSPARLDLQASPPCNRPRVRITCIQHQCLLLFFRISTFLHWPWFPNTLRGSRPYESRLRFSKITDCLSPSTSSKIPPNGLLPREQRHVGVTYDPGLVSWSSNPFVSTMNPPPQIGSRVRWWNSRGQLMHGTVRNINVLSDNSHIVVIQVEADQEPSTVSLPLDHVQPA
ncbi:hypothetical protein EDB86DRAFT_1240336 [Lactarius hatsudake]|nr:hypothetical protein EDB86DRAFT_1240336 [Lactarius hatsudake]